MGLPKVLYRFPAEGSVKVREENGQTIIEIEPFFYSPRSIATLCHVQVLGGKGETVSTQTDSLFGATGKRKTRSRASSAVPRFAAEEPESPKGKGNG